MARYITDAKRQATVGIPARKSSMKWLIIALVIVCVVVGGYFALINNAKPTATIQPPPVQPNLVPPVVSTPTQTPTQTPTPTPEKVLFGSDMGLTFWPLDSEGKKFLSYGLGFYGIPPGNYPYYDFPLVISRATEGQLQIIATIPDPDIKQIGDTWISNLITDADYNVVCKIKLTKVAEGYKYKVEFFVSPNYGVSPTGERQWLPPATFPPI